MKQSNLISTNSADTLIKNLEPPKPQGGYWVLSGIQPLHWSVDKKKFSVKSTFCKQQNGFFYKLAHLKTKTPIGLVPDQNRKSVRAYVETDQFRRRKTTFGYCACDGTYRQL